MYAQGGCATTRTAGSARKSRTADCHRCLILRNLQAARCGAATIEAMCERMRLLRARPRHILFVEGMPATSLFAVRSGWVKLVKIDEAGREHVSAMLESGDLLGLEVLFSQGYAASAEVMVDSEICVGAADDLRALMDLVPAFPLDLARYLHLQLCRTRDRQAVLGMMGAQARVAAFLLHGLAEADTDHFVAHHLTLRDLGGILGLSPETVCRSLAALKRRRLVDPVPGCVRILDLEGLRAVARH